LLVGLKFFGTNSGAFGDKTKGMVFPGTSGSSTTAEVKTVLLGVNGGASGENDEAEISHSLSTESSTADPSYNLKYTTSVKSNKI